MATQYLGADFSDMLAQDITQDTITTSKPVELVVNDAATGISKNALLHAIEAIKAKVQRDWGQAGGV